MLCSFVTNLTWSLRAVSAAIPPCTCQNTPGIFTAHPDEQTAHPMQRAVKSCKQIKRYRVSLRISFTFVPGMEQKQSLRCRRRFVSVCQSFREARAIDFEQKLSRFSSFRMQLEVFQYFNILSSQASAKLPVAMIRQFIDTAKDGL